MTESTPHQKGQDLVLRGKTTDLANWYSSCLSDDRFGAADCKMILIEQQKLMIARENSGLRIAFLGMIAVFVNINKKQDTLPAASEG